MEVAPHGARPHPREGGGVMCEACDGYGTVQRFIFGTNYGDRRVLASIVICPACDGYGWVELGAGDA